MLEDFNRLKVNVNSVSLTGRVGPDQGKPALLLLHGHPQTHLMWHRVAPALIDDYFVVLPDLRGCGDSERPEPEIDHHNYSKRQMARDAVSLMKHLGHDRFSVVGHDRGARVAARLAVDAPERIDRTMLLDIAPTLDMYERTGREFASAYWHWFALIQQTPLPESFIGNSPKIYVESLLRGGSRSGMEAFDPRVVEHYVAALTGAANARGSCEDYRASATIDLEHDRTDRGAGRKIKGPLRVLWASHGVIEKLFNPLQLWANVADDVSGKAIASGHFMPEEVPSRIVAEIRSYFK